MRIHLIVGSQTLLAKQLTMEYIRDLIRDVPDFPKKGITFKDITPVLSQLPTGFCEVPHWGYMIKGHVDLRYSDGTEEPVKTGDIFYFKPGHTAVFADDSRFVEFSPKDDMVKLLDFFKQQM
mgnify:CR=1 FL=1